LRSTCGQDVVHDDRHVEALRQPGLLEHGLGRPGRAVQLVPLCVRPTRALGVGGLHCLGDSIEAVPPAHERLGGSHDVVTAVRGRIVVGSGTHPGHWRSVTAPPRHPRPRRRITSNMTSLSKHKAPPHPRKRTGVSVLDSQRVDVGIIRPGSRVSIACGCLDASRAVHAGSRAGGLAAVGLHRIHASDAPGSAFASSAPVRRDHACRCIRRAGGRAGLCRPGGGC
jgi:hypothetical protein